MNKHKKSYKVYDEAGGVVDFSFWKHGVYLVTPLLILVLVILLAIFS